MDKTESLTDYAMRMSQKAKRLADKVTAQAMASDGFPAANVFNFVMKKEIEAQRWLEVA